MDFCPRHRSFADVAVALLFALGLSALAPGMVHAFSITPNDTVDFWPTRPGDPFGGSSTTVATINHVISLPATLNRASGALTCIGFGCSDPFDSFRIEVPTGLQINLIEFTSSRTSGPNTLYVFGSDGVSFIDPINDPVFPVNPLFTLSTSSGVLVSSSLVLGAGFYDLLIQRGAGGAWLVDFVAEPAPIPEPTSAVLIALGLLSLSVRRKATAAS